MVDSGVPLLFTGQWAQLNRVGCRPKGCAEMNDAAKKPSEGQPDSRSTGCRPAYEPPRLEKRRALVRATLFSGQSSQTNAGGLIANQAGT